MSDADDNTKANGWGVVGGIALALVLTAVTVALVITIGEMEPGDVSLIALSALVCAGVIIWGLAGGPLPPQELRITPILPGVVVGVVLMGSATERYPSFWPFMTGAALALAFVLSVLAITRHALRPMMPIPKGPAPRADLVSAGIIYLFFGVLFFQPMILRLNGHFESALPISVPGTVAGKNITHGKGGGPNITLSGPASAYLSGTTRVDYKTYDAANIGNIRCLVIHTGLLRLRWWELKPC